MSASAALAFAFFIEFRQPYFAQWIDSPGHTTLEELIPGSGSLRSDQHCYANGILLTAAIDAILETMVNSIARSWSCGSAPQANV